MYFKTCDVHTTFKKFQYTYLGLCFTQCCTGQLEEELFSLKYKGGFKTNNFQMYVAHLKKIFQQMENLKTVGYAGIDAGTNICYFLRGIDKPFLKTPVQICKSQDFYSVDFHACTSYLTKMVQKSLAEKQVHIVVTESEIEGVKLKNRNVTDQCLPPAKYSRSVYKMLSPKQMEWLWQDLKKAKANGEDIPMAKKR